MSNENDSLRWEKKGNLNTADAFTFESFKKPSDDMPKFTSYAAFNNLKRKDKTNGLSKNDLNSMTNDNPSTHLIKETTKSQNDDQEKWQHVKVQNRLEHGVKLDPNAPKFGNNNCTTAEPWREINNVDKVKIAWLSYMNSSNGQIIPFISLQSIANPYLRIPTTICRMVNNVNSDMGEVLCRKRLETAMIYWMESQLNNSNANALNRTR